MEIQLVHTTGSPSRHDSDSESSYDKNQQLKSSSEMALHRKQSRRTKKQMSERQRRKRMNSSMEKLGLLVYGKTFQDGLKVDKATLLKDAYERLQTMKDDYHRGYETAITSTATFLDHLDGCPKEVKDALTRHLHSTLQGQLCRPCHSTPLVDHHAPHHDHDDDDSHSDSCSPQPTRAPSSSSTLELPQSRQHEESERSHEARHSAPLSPLAQLSPRRPQLPYATAATPSVKEEASLSARFGSGQGGSGGIGGSSSSRPYGLAELKVPDSRAVVAEVGAFFFCGRTVAASDAGRVVGTPCRRPLVETVPPSAGSGVYTAAVSRGDTVVVKSRAASPSASTPSPFLTPSPSRFFAGMSHPRPVDAFSAGQERALRASYPTSLAYPFFPYPSPTTSTPKISPYVTPYAPQEPLYLGSTPPSLLYSGGFPASGASSPSTGVPERTNPSAGGSQLQPLLAHAAQASAHLAGVRRHYGGGSSRCGAADDSGYMSPAVAPSPHATPLMMKVVARYGGVKKHYLRELMRGGGRGEDGETDEENDREVERVFSSTRGGKYDSDSGSALTE